VTEVLAWWTVGESLLVAVVVVFYVAVAWMIADVVMRPDFTGLEKALWSIAALVFSIVTFLVYVLWVRKKDYSRA
jgi:hypothetical protein